MVSSCKRSLTGRSPTAPGVKAERDALQTTVSSQVREPASAREALGSMTDYEDWKTLAASSKRNNRGESIGHESASPRPDSGGTVLYAICRAFLPKLITGMLMIGIRAYLVEPPSVPVRPTSALDQRRWQMSATTATLPPAPVERRPFYP